MLILLNIIITNIIIANIIFWPIFYISYHITRIIIIIAIIIAIIITKFTLFTIIITILSATIYFVSLHRTRPNSVRTFLALIVTFFDILLRIIVWNIFIKIYQWLLLFQQN